MCTYKIIYVCVYVYMYNIMWMDVWMCGCVLCVSANVWKWHMCGQVHKVNYYLFCYKCNKIIVNYCMSLLIFNFLAIIYYSLLL